MTNIIFSCNSSYKTINLLFPISNSSTYPYFYLGVRYKIKQLYFTCLIPECKHTIFQITFLQYMPYSYFWGGLCLFWLLWSFYIPCHCKQSASRSAKFYLDKKTSIHLSIELIQIIWSRQWSNLFKCIVFKRKYM